MEKYGTKYLYNRETNAKLEHKQISPSPSNSFPISVPPVPTPLLHISVPSLSYPSILSPNF